MDVRLPRNFLSLTPIVRCDHSSPLSAYLDPNLAAALSDFTLFSFWSEMLVLNPNPNRSLMCAMSNHVVCWMEELQLKHDWMYPQP